VLARWQNSGKRHCSPWDRWSEESIDYVVFTLLANGWDGIDFIVHADRVLGQTEIARRYVGHQAAHFCNVMDISVYSSPLCLQRAKR